jgi:hypothetical protein
VHAVADRLEQIGDRRAVGSAAAVADVQRAGRVGGDEFDLHGTPGTEIAAAVARARIQHLADHAVVGGGREMEIDEARPGDLDLGDLRGGRQRGDDLVGDVARLGARGLGERHGHIAGEVAVGAVAGALDLDGDGEVRRETAASLQAVHGVGQELFEMLLHG